MGCTCGCVRNTAQVAGPGLNRTARRMTQGCASGPLHPRALEPHAMAMGLSEAAAATGVNRSTIYRAWKTGQISATRTDTGQIEVDPAELFRVFPPIAAQGAGRSTAQCTTTHRPAQQTAMHCASLH